jgi:hypothetical protein
VQLSPPPQAQELVPQHSLLSSPQTGWQVQPAPGQLHESAVVSSHSLPPPQAGLQAQLPPPQVQPVAPLHGQSAALQSVPHDEQSIPPQPLSSVAQT